MEFDLEQIQSTHNDLLDVAAFHARDTDALRHDVTAMLFPTAQNTPTEQLLSAVSSQLSAIVTSIYGVLTPALSHQDDLRNAVWRLLSRSGFLADKALIDFVLARIIEGRLRARLNDRGRRPIADQMPAMLLGHSDGAIADTAQILLAASSLSLDNPHLLYRELSVEMLHKLCWQIVAALQVGGAGVDKEAITNAKKFLSSHDETQVTRFAAQKLVHLLGDEDAEKCLDVEVAGIEIFVATVARVNNVDNDFVLHLLNTESAAPMAALLKPMGFDMSRAIAMISLLLEDAISARDMQLIENCYENLDVEKVQSHIMEWAAARKIAIYAQAITGAMR